MQLKEKQDETLVQAYTDARVFLKLEEKKDQAASDWVRHLRTAREARTFFSDELRSSTAFAVHISLLVAVAYIECFDGESVAYVPTAKEIEEVRANTLNLDRCIDKAHWLSSKDLPERLRHDLQALRSNLAGIIPRSSGSLGLPLRRYFVERLAEYIYLRTSSFPMGFLTVAASKGWENISDREVRNILSKSVQARISSRVAKKREEYHLQEIEYAAAANARRSAAKVFTPHIDERSDGEKLEAMMRLAATFINDTAGRDIIGTLIDRGDEHGIERPTTE